MMAFVSMFQAIEIDLHKLELQQAKQHVDFLCSFMPDNFLRRGGKSIHHIWLCCDINLIQSPITQAQDHVKSIKITLAAILISYQILGSL